MTQELVSVADLSGIFRTLSSIDGNIDRVRAEVDDVRGVVLVTHSELAALKAQLAAFEQRYERQTQIGHAETRLVKVRQELETKYGHYADIRRAAVGILQASDVSVVRNETINSVTEELMLLAPGYWLAPALVALAGWLRDDRPLAETALKEALRRDDEKTSLFFALVCRRARRGPACLTWLDRYFLQQNPRLLKRQAIVLVDGAAGGVFAPEVQQRCIERFGAWIGELASEPDFLEQQRERWRTALRGEVPADELQHTYPHLAAYSPHWNVLEALLNRIALGEKLRAHLDGIFDGPLPEPATLAQAVDGLLADLVAEHDAEELPLRREEARLQAIVSADGRIDVADQLHAAEVAALDEQSSFTQLLTNAAMHADLAGASRASQRLAVALSREWMRGAFADLLLETRNDVPQAIDVSVEGWTGETADGANEEQLVGDLCTFLQAEEEEAVAAVKLGAIHIVVGAAGVLVAIFGLINTFVLTVLGLAACGWVGYEYSQLEKRREAVREAYAQRREAGATAVRASLAEYVEWRREFARRDAVCDETETYIEALRPDAYLAGTHERTRSISIMAE
jgi:hypothetical protein